mgnify:CR=1 FL=1
MPEVYIVSAARTAIGSFGGVFARTGAVELGSVAARAALQRAGIEPARVDEVIVGNVLSAGLGQNVARQIALGAGCPDSTGAMTLNKVCGSSLRAISLSAQIIRCGDADVVLAGGTENMSMAPFLSREMRWGARMGSQEFNDSMITDGLWDAFKHYHMGMTAENVAKQCGVSRTDQDSFAEERQRRTQVCLKAGTFQHEIAPVEVHDRKGVASRVDRDEYPRPGVTVESLAKLRPAFAPDGTVTAGNSSGINDGAAMLVLLSERCISQLSLRPMARIRSYASWGVDPSIMGVAPIGAVRAAAKKASVEIDAIDLVELNEAFAAQSVAVIRDLDLDTTRTNVNGGAISLGHPIGASGARIATTLLYEMQRRSASTGLAAMCIGGGQADALIFERADDASRQF